MATHLTREEQDQLAEGIERELQRPPTIGVVGVSGASKSSTINALFRTALPVSHTIACTKRFEENELTLRINQGQSKGRATKLIVYDAPGLGEDVKKDPEYLDMYRQHLPKCDMIRSP